MQFLYFCQCCRRATQLISYEEISIKYYECVCILAIVTRHANCIFSAEYYIVTRDLTGCTVSSHYSIILSPVTWPAVPYLHITVLYCHPWPDRLYHIFTLQYYIVTRDLTGCTVSSHYSINKQHEFPEKKTVENKMFWFFYNFSEIFLIIRIIRGYIIINLHRSLCTVARHSCHIIMTPEFSW